jgi:hypothetical protein
MSKTTLATTGIAVVVITYLALSGTQKTTVDFSNRPVIKSGSFNELLTIDARGGKIIAVPKFDLGKPGASIFMHDLSLQYEKVDSTYGCYRLTITNNDNPISLSDSSTTFLPNRRYVLSILLNTNFTRVQAGKEYASEINAGLYTENHQDKIQRDTLESEDAFHWRKIAYSSGYMNGLPENTHGWARWEWEFTTADRAGQGQFWLRAFALKDYDIRIADVKFIELPALPVIPFKKGEGVTFRGGPGKLQMVVNKTETQKGLLKISTNAVAYTIDTKNNIISGTQLLEKQRQVCVWKFSVPLERLEVLKQDSTVCVLANDYLTMGLQCDGMLMIAPQQKMSLIAENKIGGKWNRLISGQLISLDDWGGYTVNPTIPLGCGKLPETEVLTPGLDFIGRINDVHFISNTPQGWQVKWNLIPGERIALSVFPPRPYDWEESFHSQIALVYPSFKTEKYDQEFKGNIDIGLLWNFNIRGWGMSFGKEYIPINENDVKTHITALKAAGIKPINYMSAHFYYSRDAEEYVNEVKRWKEKYGIEGVYSDGMPTPEWIVSYEEIRMLRELFPDGPVVIHSTGQAYGGGAPLHLPDIFMPFIDCYATATVKSEWVLAEKEGKDWQYPRYITTQYRKSNTIGITKGDRWMGVSPAEQDLITLVYNGRTWNTNDNTSSNFKEYSKNYIPLMKILEKLWKEKGNEPDFYEKYYLPKAEELTGFKRKN